MESLRQETVLATLRVERTEEPEFVFGDWAADVNASVNLGEPVRRRTRVREVLCVAHQALGCEITKSVAVKLVRSRLGDDVEDAAGRFAVLSTISARFDFDFLHELEREVRTRSAKGR